MPLGLTQDELICHSVHNPATAILEEHGSFFLDDFLIRKDVACPTVNISDFSVKILV